MECSVFGNDCDYDGSSGYFEGHLTIDVPEPLLMGVLQIVSFCNRAHLSKNAFKESKFMVTKRYYNTTKTEFIRDMDNLEHEFFKHVDVVKRIHEFYHHIFSLYLFFVAIPPLICLSALFISKIECVSSDISESILGNLSVMSLCIVS